MREIVALVTLLQDSKAALIPLLAPRWLEAVGDRDIVAVAVCNDAGGATRERFEDECAKFENVKAVVLACAQDVDAQVDDLDLAREMRDPDQQAVYWSAPLLHRIALLRESARDVVRKLDCNGRRPDWVWWLDSDIDPRPHGFEILRQDLRETTGPMAPQVVVGPYPTRVGGQDISQWVEPGSPNTYVPQREGMIQATRVAGFGCVLMRPDVMDHVGWDRYGVWRKRRRMALELGQKPAPGVLGEDVFWFRAYEMTYGITPYQDNRARCRHYHADGTYWRYDTDESGNLVAHYYTDERLLEAAVTIRNIGDKTIADQTYGVCVLPGALEVVSPEVCKELRARPDAEIEVVSHAA